jgi:hypothetical protein
MYSEVTREENNWFPKRRSGRRPVSAPFHFPLVEFPLRLDSSQQNTGWQEITRNCVQAEGIEWVHIPV